MPVSFLIKLQALGLTPGTLLKNRLWHRYFPVNFVKFLRTPFLQNTSGRLFLKISRNPKNHSNIKTSVAEFVCYMYYEVNNLIMPNMCNGNFIKVSLAEMKVSFIISKVTCATKEKLILEIPSKTKMLTQSKR